ncbi:unnamed protein product [Triticum turgidum subsp. durum]|uniref:DJ-1/PfpI domain-containing protein n=1 Tax=Triticum turgidum subsp. durum TaxID=4567 RepID=A0A9R0REG8_TRITD|nr:unnamed protein product [Triticum turgidum subsp. durum]
MEFALALVEQLYGKEKVEQIAKPMLVRYECGYSMKEVNSVEWHCSGTPKVLLPLANGIEEMEAIILVDALRRAKADVVVASIEGGVEITARYGTRIVADGGMPGAKTLGGCEQLVALLKKQAEANRPYGAIGAATAHVLEPHGLLKSGVGHCRMLAKWHNIHKVPRLRKMLRLAAAAALMFVQSGRDREGQRDNFLQNSSGVCPPAWHSRRFDEREANSG